MSLNGGRLMGGLAIVIIACLALVIMVTAVVAPQFEERALRAETRAAATRLSSMLEEPLWDLDMNAAETLGKAFASDKRVVRLTIHETESGAERLIERSATADTVLETKDVLHRGQIVGTIGLAFDRGVYRTQIFRDVIVASSLALLVLVASLTGMRWQLGKLRESEAARASAEAELQRTNSALAHAQKMDSIGRLAGGVAHDFNNMLGVIMGHVDLALHRTAPQTPLADDLQEIRKATTRSAELTRQLLAFARKQEVAPRVIDVNSVVTDSLRMLERLIGEDIELTWHPEKGLWPVSMDPSQLDQIIANLCVNARDAIADVGSLNVSTANCSVDAAWCAGHADALPGDYVRLTVRDTGRGMSDEVAAQIFEPFFTTKDIGQGTGLGLATVYGAVMQNRGFITVQSAPGKGTTFSLYLPRASESETANVAKPPTEAASGGRETILLVEDEPMLLRMTTRALEIQGYTVLSARSPADALHIESGRSGVIDLLLTDIVMPGMNGRDLAQLIVERRAGINVLFMSGYSADATRGKHGPLEDSHFLPKPFTLTELASKVRSVLDSDPVAAQFRAERAGRTA
jgi:signal transduction histidine kinase/ActR/RegA family two-component response regulator